MLSRTGTFKESAPLEGVPYHAIVEDESYVLTLSFLRNAIRSGKKFGVFGDYDADGVCSTAIFTEVLEHYGVEVARPILNNISFGFGVSSTALNYLVNQGAEVVVIFDSGTGVGAGDFAAIDDYINSDIQFVIIDHHVPSDLKVIRNRNIHIINPHMVPGSDFRFASSLRTSSLSLLIARSLLRGEKVKPTFSKRLIAMAALGGKADMMQRSEGPLHNFLLDGLDNPHDFLGILPAFRILEKQKGWTAPYGDDVWYYLAIAFGLGKFNKKGKSASCYYLLKKRTIEGAEKILTHVQRDTEGTINAVNEAISVALTGMASVEGSNTYFSILTFKELPEEFLGLTGSIAADLSRAKDGAPVFVLVETPWGYHKCSYRTYNNQANWNGEAIIQEIRQMLGDDAIQGGGHPAAGGFRVSSKALPGFLKALREVTRDAEESVE
jgi:single-stranded-DNA-specific exonuclease